MVSTLESKFKQLIELVSKLKRLKLNVHGLMREEEEWFETSLVARLLVKVDEKSDANFGGVSNENEEVEVVFPVGEGDLEETCRASDEELLALGDVQMDPVDDDISDSM